jgi:phenylpropionate dioxygenase-like ring-hydroxylating dioxygenase large terminal subunit
MLSAADNAFLTQTGPDTPMGQYFRRFWLPVLLSEEVPRPDGPPVRVKALGEDWVAFRDTQGRVGVVDPRCPHRGADLFFGRNEECGLRCVYHGWKFDVTGRAVDLPSVPAPLAERMTVAVRACPTREFGDMVWAYLGPGDPPADVPQLEAGLVPPERRYVSKKLVACNWAQSFEGALDTGHFSFLHMPAPAMALTDLPLGQVDRRRMEWMRADPQPRFTFVDHEAGFVIGAARTADGGDLYWRTTQCLLPAHSITPGNMPGELYIGYTWVPISDHECWVYTYAWHPQHPIGAAERAKFQAGFGQFPRMGPGYRPVRKRENDYLIDREAQKFRTFIGVDGIAEQDNMIQESQGLIADRTREHLIATDAAVARFRHMILADAKALQKGQAPAAPQRAGAYTVRCGGWIGAGSLTLADVMRLRYGNAAGKVPAGAPDALIPEPLAAARPA